MSCHIKYWTHSTNNATCGVLNAFFWRCHRKWFEQRVSACGDGVTITCEKSLMLEFNLTAYICDLFSVNDSHVVSSWNPFVIAKRQPTCNIEIYKQADLKNVKIEISNFQFKIKIITWKLILSNRTLNVYGLYKMITVRVLWRICSRRYVKVKNLSK